MVVGSSSSSNVGRQWLEYVEATVGVCWWSWQSKSSSSRSGNVGRQWLKYVGGRGR